MPIVLLREIDAYAAFMTPRELARDAGLGYLLLMLPVAALSGVAALIRQLLQRAGFATQDMRNKIAWSIVLLPTLAICIWQFIGIASAWSRLSLGLDLSVGIKMKVIGLSVLVVAGLILIRRYELTRLIAQTVMRLEKLRRLTLFVAAFALLSVFMTPPRLLRAATPVTAAPMGSDDRPDIYLITIDSLAELDARVCGDGPTLMPGLRDFAGKATCFGRSYSNGNFTTPGTSSIETGLLPWHHWSVQVATQIAKPLQGQTLAHRLRQAGYETHSITANILGSPRRHGTEDGFDSHTLVSSTLLANIPQFALTVFSDTTLPFWLPSILPGVNTIDMYSHGELNPYAPETAYRRVMELLDGPKSSKPRFIWVHTLPPHDPYLPPAATKYTLLPKGELERWSDFTSMGHYPPEKQALIDKYRLRYQESVLGADLALSKFMQQLAVRGRLDKAMIVVGSDHGESFERGLLGHAGPHLHTAVLQIPLVIKLPGQLSGRQIDTPVSLVDLAPTLLAFAKAEALPSVDGRNLMPALNGQTIAPAAVYSMTMEHQSRFKPIRAGTYALIEGNFKLVLQLPAQSAHLFDVSVDPQELNDLSSSLPDVKRRLTDQLNQQLQQAEAKRLQLFARP